MKRVSCLLLLCLVLTGCVQHIGRIMNDPAHYRNRSVTVEGRVVNVVGAMNNGIYQVDDGTGTIYVVSSRGVPNRNARVKVTGTVTPGVNIMGRSLGTAIQEQHHKARY